MTVEEIVACDDRGLLFTARRRCRDHVERQLINRRMAEGYPGLHGDLDADRRLAERLEKRHRTGSK
jgi:hypothetical protein